MEHQNHALTKFATSGVLRLMVSLGLAYAIYQGAANYATLDCRDLQLQIHLKGPVVITKIGMAMTIGAMLGLPAVVIAVAGGILAGSVFGAALSSLSITVASIAFWGIGKYSLIKNRTIPFEAKAKRSQWYKSMINDRAASGMHWTMTHGMLSPIPYPWFAMITAKFATHLSSASFVAGIFLASIAHIFGYALAGSSMGCALINRAAGVSFQEYRLPMLVTCIVLVLLARIQALVKKRYSR